jgi:RNase P subunit RPR2
MKLKHRTERKRQGEKHNKNAVTEIALININRLFNFGYSLIHKAKSGKQLDQALNFSRSYMKKIKAIKKHAKVRLPENVQRGYCKHCLVMFVPSKTALYRIKDKTLTIKCLVCNAIRRFKLNK